MSTYRLARMDEALGRRRPLVPPEAQRAMAASVGADVVEIDTGHSPFGEQPARLAELLVATTR